MENNVIKIENIREEVGETLLFVTGFDSVEGACGQLDAGKALSILFGTIRTSKAMMDDISPAKAAEYKNEIIAHANRLLRDLNNGKL